MGSLAALAQCGGHAGAFSSQRVAVRSACPSKTIIANTSFSLSVCARTRQTV